MKKVSLSLLALILFSSVSFSFGMDTFKKTVLIAYVCLLSGGIVYQVNQTVNLVNQTVNLVNQMDCPPPTYHLLECYNTEVGFRCYDYDGDQYDDGGCPIDSKEMYERINYAQGTCPKVEKKRRKHPNRRRSN